MIFRYTGSSRLTRRIDRLADVYTVVEYPNEPPFPSQLVDPKTDEQVVDSTSPRDVSPWRLRWRGGFQSPSGGPPGPGDRFMYRNVIFEITTAPRNVSEGFAGIQTYEVKCQPVVDLYPEVGELQEMDGIAVTPDPVNFSAFRGDETHRDQGSYEDFDAEAPIDWQAAFQMNRQIAVGNWVYRIMNVEINPVGRHLRLNLRRSGG